MLPFQQRVVDEQTELNEKIVKLTQFTATDTYRILTVEERELLTRQHYAMIEYNNVLAQRIAMFLPD